MDQNYKNHARILTGYHRVLAVLLLAGLIGSLVNLFESWNTDNLYSASLLVLLFICSLFLYWYVRVFPLKAQDRAIRAEENFRHYLLTGKILPPGLRTQQIVALRFASDEEFPELAHRSVTESLDGKSIKQAIRKWRADHYRV